MIEEEKISVDRGGCSGNFFELVRANECGRVGTIAALQNFADDVCADAFSERTQLGKRFVSVKIPECWAGGCRAWRKRLKLVQELRAKFLLKFR